MMKKLKSVYISILWSLGLRRYQNTVIPNKTRDFLDGNFAIVSKYLFKAHNCPKIFI